MLPYDGFFHYLPVNDEVLRWGAYVTGAGCGTIYPGQQYPPAGHPALYHFDWRRGRTLPEFQIVLFSDGAGEFESERTGRVAFEGATLVLLFPGVWHRYRPMPEVGWNERWLSFNGELAHRLYAGGLVGPDKAVSAVTDVDALAEKIDDVLARIHADPVTHTALHSLHVLRILAESTELATSPSHAAAHNLSTASNGRQPDPLVEHALKIIDTSSHRSISAESIARALAIARRTLDRRFAAATGRSVLDEIKLRRLRRAKRLLADTDLSIRSIAHLVGESTPERLTALFVKREGRTPADYRLQMSGKHAKFI